MEAKRRPLLSAKPPAQSARAGTTPYDSAANLTSDERILALLEAALEDGHPKVIVAALDAIARAIGVPKKGTA